MSVRILPLLLLWKLIHSLGLIYRCSFPARSHRRQRTTSSLRSSEIFGELLYWFFKFRVLPWCTIRNVLTALIILEKWWEARFRWGGSRTRQVGKSPSPRGGAVSSRKPMSFRFCAMPRLPWSSSRKGEGFTSSQAPSKIHVVNTNLTNVFQNQNIACTSFYVALTEPGFLQLI